MSDQTKYANPRLIINGVEGSLQGSRLPPASSALVRQQIEAYEGIGAIFGEGYQVTEGTIERKKNHVNHTVDIYSDLVSADAPTRGAAGPGGPPRMTNVVGPLSRCRRRGGADEDTVSKTAALIALIALIANCS